MGHQNEKMSVQNSAIPNTTNLTARPGLSTRSMKGEEEEEEEGGDEE